MSYIESWGKIHRSFGEPLFICDKSDIEFNNIDSITYHGMGRSYGDVGINNKGTLICTKKYNRLISVDWDNGLIRAESGVTLNEILKLAVPRGWFLNVAPGTRYVSLGGAIANDVHGKNHHISGSFGNYVEKISLLKSDQSSHILSRDNNRDLFETTISGLGLTGFIEWAEIRLKKINSTNMIVENIKYNSLDEFFKISHESKSWEYVAAWVDCMAPTKNIGRGVLTRSKHSNDGNINISNYKKVSLPINFPNWLLNKHSIKVFNLIYRNLASHQPKPQILDYEKVLFPLDNIKYWNRMYGSRGFYQHQSIIPKISSRKGIQELLETIKESGEGSFLAVLKNHGIESSVGRNSFCIEGTSLALDFPNNGKRTRDLLNKLNQITSKYDGKIYPAKDASMTSTIYKKAYKNWHDIEFHRDKKLSSSFWDRVND